MKIALIGATGFVGGGLLAEALDRGHEVTAVVLDPAKLPSHPRLKPARTDVADTDALQAAIRGHDVVISAFNPGRDPDGVGRRSIIEAVKASGVERLVAVGGAGSLEVAPGRRLVDQPDFPVEWKEGALRTADFLQDLRAEPELDWTFVSPAAHLAPGERTGRYRVGGDRLLTDDEGESRISLPDYAMALLDEVETPRHPRRRFCVAY